MAPPTLRNLPPLVAAATECRIVGRLFSDMAKFTPSDRRLCSLRLHGEVIVYCELRGVGFKIPKFQHEEEPRKFDHQFHVLEPDIFFRSYKACRQAIHQMFMQTPVVEEFDLAADNWDNFMPHDAATLIVKAARRRMRESAGIFESHYDVDLNVRLWVTLTYNEPTALLLACKEQAAAAAAATIQGSLTQDDTSSQCAICTESLPKEALDNATLPCSHAFHGRCIAPWFYRRTTCPMCRRDMMKYLGAITPPGRFPGLPA